MRWVGGGDVGGWSTCNTDATDKCTHAQEGGVVIIVIMCGGEGRVMYVKDALCHFFGLLLQQPEILQCIFMAWGVSFSPWRDLLKTKPQRRDLPLIAHIHSTQIH